MTTLAGTQKHFHKALYSLCELDYDAIEAYEAAINRLENHDFKEKLGAFKTDHQQHVEAITQLLRNHQQDFPQGPCPKQILTQGKVVLANIIGDDKTILKAMISNEIDTNDAYSKINSHEDIWADAINILHKGLMDEKRHKSELEDLIKTSQAKVI